LKELCHPLLQTTSQTEKFNRSAERDEYYDSAGRGGNRNGMLDERMLENVGRCKGKYKNILVALLACSRNRNDIICAGRRGDFGFFFNGTVEVFIGGMWTGQIDSRSGAAKEVGGFYCRPENQPWSKIKGVVAPGHTHLRHGNHLQHQNGFPGAKSKESLLN
jgi:hypothetical protein